MHSLIDKELYKSIDYIVCETHERSVVDGDLKIQDLKNRIYEHKIENILLDWI